jgi:hypothetical protein
MTNTWVAKFGFIEADKFRGYKIALLFTLRSISKQEISSYPLFTTAYSEGLI